tara:strand:+ start:3499 stop:3741 length:243 start_codon:yes stop_codon:yes gene_type:complete
MIDYSKLDLTNHDTLAETLVDHISWPTSIPAIAEVLCQLNPKINKDKFIKRATSNWEAKYFDQLADEQEQRSLAEDYIPY